MGSEEIELDDVQVVNVTGKVYKDKPRSRPKRCKSPSLRLRTIIIFIAIGVIFVAGVAIAISDMRVTLERLDQDALHKSIDRFTMLCYDDIGRLKPFTRHAAWQRVTAEAAMALESSFPQGNPSYTQPFVDRFVRMFLNTSVIYHEDGSAEHVYRCGSLVNWWGIIHKRTVLPPGHPQGIPPQFSSTMWGLFHPGDDDQYCTLTASSGPQPVLPNTFLMGIINSQPDVSQGWVSLYAPSGVEDIMALAIEAIMIPDEDGVVRDKTIYGYLVAGKTLKHHMPTFADNVPGCISMISKRADEKYFTEEDFKYWNTTEMGSFTEKRTFSGTPNFTVIDKEVLQKSKIRVCPSIPLFNDTDQMMAAYFILCGQDPKTAVHKTCFKLRMDRPMSRMEEGELPVILISVLILALMIILFTLFIFFLDFAVLRRVVNLSKTIRKQTLAHRDIIKDDDDEEPAEPSSKGKKGKSSSEAGKVSSSDVRAPSSNSGRGGDEIKNLRLALEQNTSRLRRRVDAVNSVVKTERQKILRHKQAMQLLSLWCDRHDIFPGLRPNATLLRYEPTRSLNDLLSNPVAIEYLKSHCDTDCTLENLFFLLDVSWLSELEAAEDDEKDPAKRKMILDVASDTASTIIARYIAEDAPQQINISAATFRVLRDEGKTYKRGMFNGAVGEVKIMLDTDILPRFQGSAAYTAMSENLYVDSFAAEDDSDLSSESVSTAGSVLSDDAGANATSSVVAFNFRNLYATFDGDTDLGSTYTNELSVIEEPPLEVQGEAKQGTVSSSHKDEEGSEQGSSSTSDGTGSVGSE